MSRKWAGLDRERHDRLKIAVMSIAMLGFIVAWVAFAAGHAPSTAESAVLSGGAVSTDRTPGAAATPAPATVEPSRPAAPPTATPTPQSDPPSAAPTPRRTSRGS